MPRYKIEATAQVRRIYEVEAASKDEADEIADTCGSEHMIHEEDVSEEIESVTLVEPEAA